MQISYILKCTGFVGVCCRCVTGSFSAATAKPGAENITQRHQQLRVTNGITGQADNTLPPVAASAAALRCAAPRSLDGNVTTLGRRSEPARPPGRSVRIGGWPTPDLAPGRPCSTRRRPVLSRPSLGEPGVRRDVSCSNCSCSGAQCSKIDGLETRVRRLHFLHLGISTCSWVVVLS